MYIYLQRDGNIFGTRGRKQEVFLVADGHALSRLEICNAALQNEVYSRASIPNFTGASRGGNWQQQRVRWICCGNECRVCIKGFSLESLNPKHMVPATLFSFLLRIQLDHRKQKLDVRHSANAQGQRPNFFVAEFSALADCEKFNLGHSLGQETP